MFILPTKEDADFIVSNSKQFFRKDDKFLDKDVSIYHYKQAKFEEFEKFKDKGSYELRGLTFVEDKRFLALHKFFELNQAPGWMEEDLKTKKIIKATEKIDGTLLQPILINNKIYFKTKLSFEAYQAKRANEMLKNPKLKEYILKKFQQNKIPIFEFVSPKTQVVLNYDKEELNLIQVRDLKTGEYELDFEKEANEYQIKTPKRYNASNLDEFLELATKEREKEGWILIFEGMKFVKIKTKEYLKRHQLLAKIQPHDIIKAILEKRDKEYEEMLNKQSEKYQYFKDIKTRFLQKYNSLKKEAKKATKLSKKELKKRYSSHPYYELFAYCKNNGLEVFDEWIKQHTSKLKGAKKFLEL
jgi:RNA ligase